MNNLRIIYPLLVLIIGFSLNSCQQEEPITLANSELENDIKWANAQEIPDIKTDNLSDEQILSFAKQLENLGYLENDFDGHFAPTCGGLIYYPNGNSTAPCLVKHKIIVLDDFFIPYEGTGYILFWYRIVTLDPSSNIICTDYVLDAPSLYNYECELPTTGTFPMLIISDRIVNGSQGLQLISIKECQSFYTCG